MGKYNFDKVIERRGTNSYKWDTLKEGELPMWVADMDFEVAPEIKETIVNRASHGVFGYSITPKEWGESYVSWWKNRHDFEIEEKWLTFTTGVIPILSSCVRKLTTPAEKVLIQTPVYNMFFNSVINNGRRILDNPLKYEGGQYTIDWEDLEEKLSDKECTLMILCNPHNPVGKIWSRDELVRIANLCKANGVLVISDEIHCDITDPGVSYIPFASVNETAKEISVTAIAPTKCFNLAGIQSAATMVPEKHLRDRVIRALNTDEVAETNVFGAEVAVAAFTKGGEWLDEFREYIYGNKQLVCEFIKENMPDIYVVPGQATYLLWLDISKVSDNATEYCNHIRETSGLVLSDGSVYGENGKTFLRMNIAAPKSLVEDGLNRLLLSYRKAKLS